MSITFALHFAKMILTKVTHFGNMLIRQTLLKILFLYNSLFDGLNQRMLKTNVISRKLN